MTLSPLLNEYVLGVPGSVYRVGPRCSVPGCGKISEHAHHLWRRSKLGKPYAWVEVRETEHGEPQVIGNLTGLCVEHHDDVTVHRAWIKWIDGVFYWGDNVGTDPAFPVFRAVAPLDPQPPTPETLDVSQPDSQDESDVCPTCGQHKVRRRSPDAAGERRPRKSWVVKVPDDAEDGAAILDAFVDDLAPVLGFDPAASARYFVINAAFVYVEQDRHAFIEAVAGIGGQREEHDHA
jgi:hypothetical protein